jgi:hypothetical protein
LGWPPRPSDDSAGKEYDKAKLLAQIEIRKKRADADEARRLENRKAFLQSDADFHKSLIEVGKGSIDRTRASAELVQKAAGVIAGLYTGALAVAFSVAENPLPPRGLFAVAMLGLAVVLSTGFLAYLTDPGDRNLPAPTGSDQAAADSRAIFFIDWVQDAALRGRQWLQAAVLALGLSLLFLPAPFVELETDSTEPAATAVETTDASLPKWPGPPTEVGVRSLQMILYQAQVAETAAARTAATSDEPVASTADDDRTWTIAFLASLVIVSLPLLYALVRRRGSTDAA